MKAQQTSFGLWQVKIRLLVKFQHCGLSMDCQLSTGSHKTVPFKSQGNSNFDLQGQKLLRKCCISICIHLDLNGIEIILLYPSTNEKAYNGFPRKSAYPLHTKGTSSIDFWYGLQGWVPLNPEWLKITYPGYWYDLGGPDPGPFMNHYAFT